MIKLGDCIKEYLFWQFLRFQSNYRHEKGFLAKGPIVLDLKCGYMVAVNVPNSKGARTTNTVSTYLIFSRIIPYLKMIHSLEEANPTGSYDMISHQFISTNAIEFYEHRKIEKYDII
uniref:Uncharacterized protein n=1 Tax=Cacopsylla melanoneura TaxID=428564 RepID=A0A8D9EAI9_9HEMI